MANEAFKSVLKHDDLRKLAISLLHNDEGISETAWLLLRVQLEADEGCEDIINAVEATEGKFYLPPDFQNA